MTRLSTGNATTLIANENVGMGRSGTVMREMPTGAARASRFTVTGQPGDFPPDQRSTLGHGDVESLGFPKL